MVTECSVRLRRSEAAAVRTYISDEHFLAVIHAGNGGLALRYEVVIGDVVGEQANFCA